MVVLQTRRVWAPRFWLVRVHHLPYSSDTLVASASWWEAKAIITMLSARPPSFNDHLDHVRTPGKALKHRGVLQENAVHKGDVIANGKGKLAISRTPFHNTTRTC